MKIYIYKQPWWKKPVLVPGITYEEIMANPITNQDQLVEFPKTNYTYRVDPYPKEGKPNQVMITYWGPEVPTGYIRHYGRFELNPGGYMVLEDKGLGYYNDWRPTGYNTAFFDYYEECDTLYLKRAHYGFWIFSKVLAALLIMSLVLAVLHRIKQG